MLKPAIYLSGPMTGKPNYNRELFNEVAEALTEGGWAVFNPAANELELFGSYEACDKALVEDRQEALRMLLRADLEYITQWAEAIAMLPGWETSLGARAEHATAVALGLQIIYFTE